MYPCFVRAQGCMKQEPTNRLGEPKFKCGMARSFNKEKPETFNRAPT